MEPIPLPSFLNIFLPEETGRSALTDGFPSIFFAQGEVS
jgi:hypothetical protein